MHTRGEGPEEEGGDRKDRFERSVLVMGEGFRIQRVFFHSTVDVVDGGALLGLKERGMRR